MARATSISVSKLSSVVQDAVKAAVERHPTVKIDPATPMSLHYLIWGIPVPEQVAQSLTLRDTQAFANEVATKVGASFGPGQRVEGAIFSHGGHLILGFPVPPEVLFER